ncbi:hypothetical protein C2E21_8057 [Chlorella sorokiniana]|uniref:Uncharacterized protein n=1 Tax=Chlorella sorokiniana TaxID=3076 RepID=A0A2P6TFU5_CHLSO|nr:hypothetical protein C2E21_8057 [Chlorella sorokiniana]|eukprot:PRW32975.1 hypothetical protein C2E21_8057 [Chlorella sorokiniana]
MPSRLGATPGAKAAAQFEVPLSARAAAADAAPATGKNLKSILKRLNFSATKARAAAAAHAGDEPPATAATAAQAAPTAGPAAQSTIKQLRFDVGATPAVPTAAKPGSRHVSFDAATVSPAPRGSRLGRGSGAPASALRTPEPPIQEEASGGSSEDGGAGAGSVNSAAAGHTPYDRRLSSLFRKYQVAGTPELADADLDGLVADGVVRSPSWKRLSSASVPESIKELAKKYTSDGELSLQSLSISPAPAAVAEGSEAEAATPQPARAGTPGDGSSPALAPTPHDLINSMMKRNELFESSPCEAPASAARAAAAAISAGPEAAASAGPLSPGSAVAQLLAPVLLATIKEIDDTKQAQPASPAPAAAASPSVGSPAEFYGFTLAQELSTTPHTAAAPRSASVDGIPRNADGIPTVTPHTVTVRRGSSGAGLAAVLEEEGELAANLFDCFSPLSADHAFTPPEGDAKASPGAANGEGDSYSTLGDGVSAAGAAFGSFSAGRGDPAAATPADAGADFSFFPTMAPGGLVADAAAAGATPELQGGAPAAAAGTSYVSPEILGFYEQAQRAAGSSQAGTSSQAAGLGTPALPRSIIKSGRPLNEAGTPVLGHAQRAPAGEAPPHTITKELQALMRDLHLEDPAELEEMGTVSTLSPVRATGPLRGFLGGLARAITPVRRSARKKAAGKPLEAMLEETGFSYVPNAALMPEDAPPKQEAAEAKAARKAARQADSQVSAGEPSLADMVGSSAAEDGQAEVSSAASSRRYSTRSAARAEPAGEEQQDEPAGAATTAAAATPEAGTAAGRRMSLRHLRTPKQQAHMEGAENEACTPAAPTAADTPVAQDASPQLAESPIYAHPAEAAAAAAEAATPGKRAYSLRASTVQKTRQSLGTPLQPANTPPGAASGKKERRGGKPQLSPTEQGIRASLRRSARKSRGAAS